MQISRLISAFVILTGLFLCPFTAYAQDNPDYVTPAVNEDNSAHWALRGFSEIGMGLLFGTAAGGGALITGALIDPKNIKYTLLASAIIYPRGCERRHFGRIPDRFEIDLLGTIYRRLCRRACRRHYGIFYIG